MDDVLKHPNWKMGQKITIDSATMINKLFELIEAYWLFRNCFASEVLLDAIIETNSIVHSIIDFYDGSSLAHIATADMRLPIAYALGITDKQIVNHIDLTKIKKIEFRNIDPNRYEIWGIKEDILRNPEKGVIINAANEVMIKKFINKKIGFLDIAKGIIKGYKKFYDYKIDKIEDVFLIDKEVREFIGGEY